MRTPDHLGRIRINENEARTLVSILRMRRHELATARKFAVEAGRDSYEFNREMHHIRKIWQEVSLLAEQKGWTLEPESSHKKGPDTQVSGGTPRGVGQWERSGNRGGWRIGGPAPSQGATRRGPAD